MNSEIMKNELSVPQRRGETGGGEITFYCNLISDFVLGFLPHCCGTLLACIKL
jgi:hypothetical protein